MPTKQPDVEPEMVELDETFLEVVAGGLNPQPLPPCHEQFRFA